MDPRRDPEVIWFKEQETNLKDKDCQWRERMLEAQLKKSHSPRAKAYDELKSAIDKYDGPVTPVPASIVHKDKGSELVLKRNNAFPKPGFTLGDLKEFCIQAEVHDVPDSQYLVLTYRYNFSRSSDREVDTMYFPLEGHENYLPQKPKVEQLNGLQALGKFITQHPYAFASLWVLAFILDSIIGHFVL